MQKVKSGLVDLLRWSEKYTKTDMVYIAKGGFWLTTGQIVASFSVFILSILFANLVSAENYGIYKYVISMASIIGSFSLVGLGTAVLQASSNEHISFFKKAVKTSIKWSVFLILAGIFLSIYYFFKSNYILGISFLIVSIFPPITNSLGLYGSFWSGKQNFKKTTLFFIVVQSITVVTLALAIIFYPNVSFLIFIYFLIPAIGATIGYIHTIKYINKIDNPNKGDDDKYIKYGKHLSIMGIIDTIAMQIDKIILFQFLGSLPVAIYSFAQAIPEQLKGSFKNMFALALPKYSSSSNNISKKSILDKILRLTIISIFFTIIYIIIAPIIFEIFFPKYIESIKYSQIYMLGFITIPTTMMASTYFRAKKNTSALYIVTTFGNIISIILLITLTLMFGIMGVILGKIISMVFIAILSLVYLIKDSSETSSL